MKTDMMDTPSDRLNLFFPIPVFVTKIANPDELNMQLRQLIEEEWKADPGITISNQGGWHSKKSLFQSNHLAVTQFKEEIRNAIKELLFQLYGSIPNDQPEDFEIQAWANINTHDTFNRPHDHKHFA